MNHSWYFVFTNSQDVLKVKPPPGQNTRIQGVTKRPVWEFLVEDLRLQLLVGRRHMSPGLCPRQVTREHPSAGPRRPAPRTLLLMRLYRRTWETSRSCLLTSIPRLTFCNWFQSEDRHLPRGMGSALSCWEPPPFPPCRSLLPAPGILHGKRYRTRKAARVSGARGAAPLLSGSRLLGASPTHRPALWAPAPTPWDLVLPGGGPPGAGQGCEGPPRAELPGRLCDGSEGLSPCQFRVLEGSRQTAQVWRQKYLQGLRTKLTGKKVTPKPLRVREEGWWPRGGRFREGHSHTHESSWALPPGQGCGDRGPGPARGDSRGRGCRSGWKRNTGHGQGHRLSRKLQFRGKKSFLFTLVTQKSHIITEFLLRLATQHQLPMRTYHYSFFYCEIRRFGY